MGIRVSGVAVWLSVVMLAGGAAASHGFRQFSVLASQKTVAEAEATNREAEILELRRQIATLRGVLAFERGERVSAQRALTKTRSMVRDVLTRLERQQADDKQLATENLSLRRCLAGLFEALPLLSGGDAFRAMHVMMTVDAPCRAAQEMLNAQGAASR